MFRSHKDSNNNLSHVDIKSTTIENKLDELASLLGQTTSKSVHSSHDLLSEIKYSNYLEQTFSLRSLNKYKPLPDDINFGIEMEIFFPKCVQLDALSEWFQMNISQVEATESQCIKFASPILNGEAGLINCANFLLKCKAYGGQIDKSSSINVFLNPNNLILYNIPTEYMVYSDALKKLCFCFLKYEKTIDLFMHSSRVNHSQAFKSNRDLFPNDDIDMMKMIYSIQSNDREKIPEILVKHFAPDSHYKMTISNMFKCGTIEFRQHEATLAIDEVEAWLRFVIWFVHHSLLERRYDLTHYSSLFDYFGSKANLSISESFNELFNTFIQDENLKRFFLNKIKTKIWMHDLNE